jgi:hypothetical protein
VDNEVEVVIHQAVSEADRAIFCEPGGDNFQESPAVDVIREDECLAISSRHHVIGRPAESNPVLSSHGVG